MEAILDLFRKITRIPRCSAKAEKMAAFIIQKAEEAGCDVTRDEASNILATKGAPEVCLQAHYDMVCVGRAPQIELIEEEGMLRAKESTLGADNGIGVAMALHFLFVHDNLEALFTADEEIGLIGATRLELRPKAKRLLNLDSEEEGAIFIGCAGAVEVHTEKPVTRRAAASGMSLYRVDAGPFAGGHSGVDIDKNIPNAIKELAFALKDAACEIVSIEGGEADNAIPRRASAVVVAARMPEIDHEKITVTPLDKRATEIMAEGREILTLLRCFPHGVRAWNPERGIVEDSINLAMIESREKSVAITLFARSMENGRLERLKEETGACFETFGFDLRFERQMPAWKPEATPFAQRLLTLAQKIYPDASFKAIHAGLECGIIQDRIPGLQSASIGPNIYAPHSVDERVELESVYRTARVVEALIKALEEEGS